MEVAMVVRMFAAALFVACLIGGVAYGGPSFVVSDGLNRAPAVTLHCLAGSFAVPCGTTAQPVVVAPVSGGATAANQSTEINNQQALSTSLGSQSDPIYVGGNGSTIALLKGLFTSLANGTTAVPTGGQPVSRSTNVIASQSTQLFPGNPGRHYLGFQAPSGTAVWVNFVGGSAAPNGLDCISLPAGTVYESGPYVIRGAISIYSPINTAISAWEG
jgi:hypothetical protein